MHIRNLATGGVVAMLAGYLLPTNWLLIAIAVAAIALVYRASERHAAILIGAVIGLLLISQPAAAAIAGAGAAGCMLATREHLLL